jgi:hypothetical protein
MNKKRKSPVTHALLANLAELQGQVKRGMTGAEIAGEIGRQYPRRANNPNISRRRFRAQAISQDH